MIKTVSNSAFVVFQALASAAILGAALISQYGFGLHPCHLCLLQRYPYAAVIIVAIIGLIIGRKYSIHNYPHPTPLPAREREAAALRQQSAAGEGKINYIYYLILLNLLLFLVDGGIAAYHAGVELGVFPGPTDCTATAGGDTLEELRASIMAAPLVSCSQAMAHFMGLSMAAWNAIAAFGLSIISGIYLWRRRYA